MSASWKGQLMALMKFPFILLMVCLTEDRALMFDSEIRGQLAMLMGGRAAEQLTCAGVSTGEQQGLLLLGRKGNLGLEQPSKLDPRALRMCVCVHYYYAIKGRAGAGWQV
jgi:hypothetical protein